MKLAFLELRRHTYYARYHTYLEKSLPEGIPVSHPEAVLPLLRDVKKSWPELSAILAMESKRWEPVKEVCKFFEEIVRPTKFSILVACHDLRIDHEQLVKFIELELRAETDLDGIETIDSILSGFSDYRAACALSTDLAELDVVFESSSSEGNDRIRKELKGVIARLTEEHFEYGFEDDKKPQFWEPTLKRIEKQSHCRRRQSLGLETRQIAERVVRTQYASRTP